VEVKKQRQSHTFPHVEYGVSVVLVAMLNSLFYFVTASLAALIYQHTITPLALPCKLLLPDPGTGSMLTHYTLCADTLHSADTLYSMLTHYTLCWHIILYADTLYSMLTHYTLCWYIILYVDTFYSMLIYYPLCWYIILYVDTLCFSLTHDILCWLTWFTKADSCWHFMLYFYLIY